MKTKTIRQNLRRKFDQWTQSIEDESLRERVRKNSIITGGAIASMLLREKVNDYDVYFRDMETTKLVAEYYVTKFKEMPRKQTGIECDIRAEVVDRRVRIVVKSAGIAKEGGTETPYEYFESSAPNRAEGYVAETLADSGEIEERYEETQEQVLEQEEDQKFKPVFLSTNAITLSGRIQLVLRFYGEPDSIHENYDFVHCTNYWTSREDKVVLKPDALECLLTRELRYIGSRYPVCSVIRLRKFISRGWTVNAGQILKMLLQVSELDLTNPIVLEDQLTGVDAAYFCELIAKVKEKDPEKINSAYLIEIIDRMF
jgi:hypothetical protein